MSTTLMNTTIIHITFAELCELERIESDILIELVGHGIVTPVSGQLATDWVFETNAVPWIKKAVRLAGDLELDWVAVALVIDLMQQKEALERENQNYRLQLERFIER